MKKFRIWMWCLTLVSLLVFTAACGGKQTSPTGTTPCPAFEEEVEQGPQSAKDAEENTPPEEDGKDEDGKTPPEQDEMPKVKPPRRKRPIRPAPMPTPRPKPTL